MTGFGTSEYETPTSVCPCCAATLNCVVDAVGATRGPQAADITVCWECASLLQFDERLLLCPAPDGDAVLDSLPSGPREMMQTFLRERRADIAAKRFGEL